MFLERSNLFVSLPKKIASFVRCKCAFVIFFLMNIVNRSYTLNNIALKIQHHSSLLPRWIEILNPLLRVRRQQLTGNLNLNKLEWLFNGSTPLSLISTARCSIRHPTQWSILSTYSTKVLHLSFFSHLFHQFTALGNPQWGFGDSEAKFCFELSVFPKPKM